MTILMPIIQAVLGVISVLVDEKYRKKRWVTPLMIGLFTLAAIITIYINRQEALTKESALNDTKKAYDGLRKDNERLEGHILTMLRGFGFIKSEVSQQDLRQIIEADKTLRNLQRAIRAGKETTVEYFQKDVDTEIVNIELQKLGFIFKVKPPVNNLPTNAMWVGDKVPIDEVHKVALTLIRAGVELHSIARFHKSSAEKDLLIQVGADPGVMSWPVLSVLDIMNLKELKRFPA